MVWRARPARRTCGGCGKIPHQTTIILVKKIIIPILAITAFVSLSACGTYRDDRRGPYVRHDRYYEDRGPRDPGPSIEITAQPRRGY